MTKKTNICVSVDMDTLMIAKTKVDNISKYVNECLIGLGGKTASDMKEEELKEELERLKEIAQDTAIRTSFINQTLNTIKEERLQKSKEIAEMEQFNRWVCPVCKHQNFMEAERCAGRCQLPTKNDKKTVIVNIKGDSNAIL